MGETGLYMLACMCGFVMGLAVGSGDARTIKACIKVGVVVIDGKVYDCKLREAKQ